VPQINDTTGGVKTSSVLRVDVKAEGFERIAIPRGLVDIAEGGLMVRGADGAAAKPAATARQVYINFSNPNAPQTKDQQAIHVAGEGATFSVALSSGGYAGVNGSGLRIGLPFTDQFFKAGDLTAIEGEGPGCRLTILAETDSAAARYPDVKFAYPTGGAGVLAAGELCFAVVEFIEGTLIWMTFDSMGRKN